MKARFEKRLSKRVTASRLLLILIEKLLYWRKIHMCVLFFILFSSQLRHLYFFRITEDFLTDSIYWSQTQQKATQLNQCYVDANNKHIRGLIENWKNLSIPLFSSIVKTPSRSLGHRDSTSYWTRGSTSYWTAHFSLWHLTRLKPWRPSRKDKVAKFWNQMANWSCDGEKAVVVQNGFREGLSVRCPNTRPITNIYVNEHKYFVGDHVSCEQNYPLHASDHSTESLIVGTALVYDLSLEVLFEWIEYHRLIGIHHFYLYILGNQTTNWPNVDYVTYIPWDLNPTMTRKEDIFLFQTASQANMIHRGRKLGISWIAFNDVDEFLVPKGNYTVRSVLSDHAGASALISETVAFGGATNGEEQRYIMNYTTRTLKSFFWRRTKHMVRPKYVDYSLIHYPVGNTTGPLGWIEAEKCWIHHYKNPSNGVFFGEKKDRRFVQDTALRDNYLEVVKARVDEIVSDFPR